MPGIDIVSVQEIQGTKFALGMEYTHDNLINYWKAGYGKPVMVNEVNFGDMRGHPTGGTKGWVEERQHLWVTFASGGHTARTGFQPFSAIYPSLNSCLNLANFIRYIRFWRMNPLVNFVVSCNGIYYSMGSDDEYVVYIRSINQKNEGKIKLELPSDNYTVRWYDPVRGIFLPSEKVVNGGTLELALPVMAAEATLYISKSPKKF